MGHFKYLCEYEYDYDYDYEKPPGPSPASIFLRSELLEKPTLFVM